MYTICNHTITPKLHIGLRLKHGLVTLFTIKCPLNYQMPQSVCSAHSDLVFDNSLPGSKIGGNRGRNGWILTPNELAFTFWLPDYDAKFFHN